MRYFVSLRKGLYPGLLAGVRFKSSLTRGMASALSDTMPYPKSKEPGQPINWVLPCRPKQYNREAIAACFPTFPEEILPNWFSCDWLSWSSAHFFFIPYYWHNISVAEATITRLFKLPGKLRPLAFMEGADIIVLVAAGKEYALWDAVNEDLTRFGSDFASDEAFLARFHGLYWNEMKRIGMVVARPRNHRAIYKKIGMEQAELVRTVEGRIAFDANGIAQSVSPTLRGPGIFL